MIVDLKKPKVEPLESLGVTPSQFRKHLERASKIVQSWTEWNRNCLGTWRSPVVEQGEGS